MSPWPGMNPATLAASCVDSLLFLLRLDITSQAAMAAPWHKAVPSCSSLTISADRAKFKEDYPKDMQET